MLNKIKSRFILSLLFENLKKRLKLKIIKINKKMLYRLNITIKDFQDYKTLKELNTKYDFHIQDIDINKIDLSNKIQGTEILEYINDINFKKLKELDLQHNSISDIKVLQNLKMANLEILNLMGNKISNINILEKVNLNKLEKLDSSFNEISNINILEKVNFSQLKELNLYNNEITDIKILENVRFERLEILNLGSNKISNISILGNVNFKELKKLYLYNTIYIKNIKGNILNILF